MVDGWLTCNNCGKRYGTFISNCPSCGAKSPASKKKMGKWKKVGIIASIVVVAWVTFNVSVYYSDPQAKAKVDAIANSMDQTNPNDIVGVVDFGMSRDGSLYQVHFGLSDKNLNRVASNAKVSFMIRNYTIQDVIGNKVTRDGGQLVYSKDFNVKASDFDEYQRAFTGAGTGKEYLWLIDGEELKGMGTYAREYLTVTLPNGKSFSAED